MNTRNPPAGTIALVRAEIEGAEPLWNEFAVEMGEALEDFLELMERLNDESFGWEIETDGEAFMAAFDTATDALRFCLRAQEMLLELPWPTVLVQQEEPKLWRGLRARMGIHSGTVDPVKDPVTGQVHYRGAPVVRVTRIAEAAAGGQILLGARAWEEAARGRDSLGDPVIVELGEHRLRDLEAPERLVSAVPRALAARRFAAPQTIDARRTNLGSPPGTFVGRVAELASLRSALDGPARIASVTGPAGIGKSRLARRFAAHELERCPGGAWICDATDARELDDLVGAVAEALSLSLPPGMSSAEAVAAIGADLSRRGRVLLVVDGVPAAGAAGALVAWSGLAKEARIVATARAPLGLPGEAVLSLGPLPLPSPELPALESDAVALFAERAAAADPEWRLTDVDLPIVVDIVRKMGGHPLAIELVAARASTYSPSRLFERLASRFDPAQPVRDPLTIAMEWAWDLLEPMERFALAQASVFRGGFSLAAAEEVFDLSRFEEIREAVDLVQSLWDCGLLTVVEVPELDDELRCSFHESVAELARAELAASEFTQPAEANHALHYLDAADEWIARLGGPEGPASLRRLSIEHANFAAIAERALAVRPATNASAMEALRAARALDCVLSRRGPVDARISWLLAAVGAATRAGVSGSLLDASRASLAAARELAGADPRTGESDR